MWSLGFGMPLTWHLSIPPASCGVRSGSCLLMVGTLHPCSKPEG